MNWILICGGPHTGKTTLAHSLARSGCFTLHTDHYLGKVNADLPHELAHDMHAHNATVPDRLIIVEGCAGPRLMSRLPILDLPRPSLIVWLGPRMPGHYKPFHRGLITLQRNKLHGHTVTYLAAFPQPSEVPLAE